MVPLIAIPCRRITHTERGDGAQSVLDSYLYAMSSVGVATTLIPMQSVELACEALRRADGLLLAGGEDVMSDRAVIADRKLNPTRDDVELSLARKAIEMRMPILGICRGLHVLNAAHGGTVALLANVVSAPMRHVTDWRRGEMYVHSVELRLGSTLASLAGRTEARVNGTHAHCVHRVGQGLQIAAVAPDGVVECVESMEGDIIGVQWHPEALIASADELALRLLEWFARQAAAFAGATG